MLTSEVKSSLLNYVLISIEKTKLKKKSMKLDLHTLYFKELRELSETDLIELEDFIIQELVARGFKLNKNKITWS